MNAGFMKFIPQIQRSRRKKTRPHSWLQAVRVHSSQPELYIDHCQAPGLLCTCELSPALSSKPLPALPPPSAASPPVPISSLSALLISSWGRSVRWCPSDTYPAWIWGELTHASAQRQGDIHQSVHPRTLVSSQPGCPLPPLPWVLLHFLFASSSRLLCFSSVPLRRLISNRWKR